MRWAVAIAAFIEVPITVINTKYVGTAPWLKWPLMIDLILVFLALSVSCRYVAQRGKDMIETQAESAKKTSRIETELDLATKIQTSMLPCILPAVPGHENIDPFDDITIMAVKIKE